MTRVVRPLLPWDSACRLLSTTFSVVMANYKVQNLNGYLELGAQDCVCSVGQNPKSRPLCSRDKPYLHTLIANCCPMYSLEHKRWLTGRESLATNTYVCCPALSQHGEATPFLFERADVGLPPRGRHHLFAQAGDGMSLPSVGLALLWYLHLELGPTPQESLQSSSFLRQLSSVLSSPSRYESRKRKRDDPDEPQ